MNPSFHRISRLFVLSFENNTDRTEYRESWTLDTWFGRMVWTLGLWTTGPWTTGWLDSERLDSGRLDSGCLDSKQVDA